MGFYRLLLLYRQWQPAAIMNYGIHVECTNTTRMGSWVKSVEWGVAVNMMKCRSTELDACVSTCPNIYAVLTIVVVLYEKLIFSNVCKVYCIHLEF